MLEDQSYQPKTGFLSSISTEKRWVLFAYFPGLLLLLLVGGIVLDSAYPAAGRIVEIVFGILANVLVFVWCRLDGDERGYKFHRLFALGVIIFGFLALFYYLFRSRGFQAGLVAIGWFILYVVSTYIVVLIVSLLILMILLLTGAISSKVFG